MEILSALLALCAGNSPVTGEFPTQRPVTRSFDVFFHLCLNKRLSKQSWGWWFETPSRSLWRHCNVVMRPHASHRTILPSYMLCVKYPPMTEGDTYVGDLTDKNTHVNSIEHVIWRPGPRLNIKTVLSTYGDFHVKDKTAVRTSYL